MRCWAVCLLLLPPVSSLATLQYLEYNEQYSERYSAWPP